MRDEEGNTVDGSTASITVAITSGTGTSGAELGGTLTRAAVDGVSTFDDLTVDKVGADYTLTATAADLESSVSAPFTVTLVLSGEGPNISTWEFAFGDGNIPPDATSTEADYTVSHVDSMSTITVNSRQRPDVGLHGIYLLRRETDAALTAKMTYSIQFRLPDAVSIAAHQAGNPTGQTIDMTLFSWDGKTSRRDYGFAISIITNPYFQTGHVRYWVTDADGNGSWEDTGVVLDLDTEWHTVELSVDPVSDSGVAKIDEAIVVTAPRAKEAKPTFGDDVTARVSVEVISVDPGSDNGGRSARLQVRNWSWIWSPDG
ncbi:MAG: hypothetical protein IH968_06055 [Gemmatimonadetes bacterium]|nr:hypothetical protein [Gemmatimonadota bacterium]